MVLQLWALLIYVASLIGISPSRSGVSRLRLFRDEDVSGAVFSRLYGRGIRRGGGARRKLSGLARRIAEAADGRGARYRLGENGIRGGRRHSCTPRQAHARVAAIAGVRSPNRPVARRYRAEIAEAG